MTKVFITGVTGFIAGTVLEQLTVAYPSLEITALARTQAKADQITAKFPTVATVIGDLDSTDLIGSQSELADIVINGADADHEGSLKAIIHGLEKRGGGYLIHTGGLGLLFSLPGADVSTEKIWDDIEDLKELSSFPDTAYHRLTDKIVLGAPASVRTAIISPGKVYGVGTGPDRIYTIPFIPNNMISSGVAYYVNAGTAAMSTIHVKDLARIYVMILGEALKPNGGTADWDSKGYYFGVEGEVSIADHVTIAAEELAKLGHIKSNKVESYTIAKVAEMHPFFPILYGSTSRAKASRAKKLGWKPIEPAFLETIGSDIRSEYASKPTPEALKA